MKAGFFTAVVALLQLAAAQPHKILHRHVHEKRDIVTEWNTVFTPQVIVWVDQQGHTVSVETVAAKPSQTPRPHRHRPQEQQSTPAPMVTTSTPPAPVSPPPKVPSKVADVAPQSSVPQYSPAPPPPSPSPEVAPSSSTSSAAPSSSPTSDSGSMLGVGMGVTYSPYNGDDSCKSQEQVDKDFEQINGYDIVRIYGVDCNQATTVIGAARRKGMRVFAGIFDLSSVSDDISTLAEALDNDWSIIDTVSIGNELVNGGRASVPDVVAALKAARGQLKGLGFTGSVVTVDTFNALIDNPELCQESDYCAANCHAFFNNEVEASGAGDFVMEQAKLVSQAAGGKNTIVTESGWPSGGDHNGAAVPSKQNQQAAIESLKKAFSGNLFVFNAFNDQWKEDFTGSFGAERFWGIYGDSQA